MDLGSVGWHRIHQGHHQVLEMWCFNKALAIPSKLLECYQKLFLDAERSLKARWSREMFGCLLIQSIASLTLLWRQCNDFFVHADSVEIDDLFFGYRFIAKDLFAVSRQDTNVAMENTWCQTQLCFISMSHCECKSTERWLENHSWSPKPAGRASVHWSNRRSRILLFQKPIIPHLNGSRSYIEPNDPILQRVYGIPLRKSLSMDIRRPTLLWQVAAASFSARSALAIKVQRGVDLSLNSLDTSVLKASYV